MSVTKSRDGVLVRRTVAWALLMFCAHINAQEQSEAERHVAAARVLAATDLAVQYNFFCVPGNARPNNFAAPDLVPVKLFDNLYAVGNSETVVYALTTSTGIVLFDSGYPGTVESVILPGLQALGLDPANIKYVLLGHGHNDHYGGAAFLQSHYGAKVGTTEADWDTVANDPPSAQFSDASKPTRDLVVIDNKPLVVGDTTITPVAIPGHTPGSLAFIFPVSDGGQPHVAGLFGGTVLASRFVSQAALAQYIQSIAKFSEIAQRMQVDVEVQNHPIFDDTPARLAALATRKPGQSHPFVMGTQRYVRFWGVVSECMQGELARRSATQ